MTVTKLKLRWLGILAVLPLIWGTVLMPAGAQSPKVVAKIGIAFGNETNPIVMSTMRWAQLVKERSGGEIDIQIFPGGQLGGEVEMAEGLRLGSLQGALVEVGALSSWVPQGTVFSLPFIFRSDDHVLATYSGPVGERIASYFPPQGFRVLGFWTSGARHPMGTFKVETPDDVIGKKMRTMQVQLHLDAWNAAGANPTPLPFPEVMNALKTGVIDYFDSIGSSYFNLKFYEVAPHMSVLGHIYAIFAMTLSEDWWQKQTPEHRDIMQTAFRDLIPMAHHLVLFENARGPEKAAEMGATVTVVRDKKAWQEKMLPVWEKWAAEVEDGKDLIEAVSSTQ